MNLCDNDHEEIVYAYKYCPLCDVKQELGELREELEKALDQLKQE